MASTHVVSLASLLARAGLVLSLLGCPGDPVPAGSHGGTSTGGTDASPDATTTLGSSSSTGDPSTTAAVDSTGDDSTFLVTTDYHHGNDCNLARQDCARGFKCVPWANDGGPAWNATQCVPVVDDPAGTYQPCHVEGSPLSGVDDCDYGMICWGVDPRTLQGECIPFCFGDQGAAECVAMGGYCPIVGDGAVLLCQEACDPLLPECSPGWGCYPLQDQWVCALDGSGDEGTHGDPCEFINGCDPGLVCLDSSMAPAGLPCEGASGCCTEICDLTDPLGDQQCTGWAEGQTCQAWYEPGTAPMGLENLGRCALPL